jgi:hypothetical protein
MRFIKIFTQTETSGLKRRLKGIVSFVDGQCGSRTSRGRRIDSGGICHI